jgi:hypothetical protein
MARHDQKPADWMLACVLCDTGKARPKGVLCESCYMRVKAEVA